MNTKSVFGRRLGLEKTIQQKGCRFRAARKRRAFEIVKISLFSCNPEAVYSDVKFVVVSPSEAEDSVVESSQDALALS